MADQGRHPRVWERFTCISCGKAVRRRPAPRPTERQCLCCSFLDTVHDARMREALRRVLNGESE